MNQIFSILIFSTILAFTSSSANTQIVTHTYKESAEDFSNPERGFYVPADAHAGKFVSLNAGILKKNRTHLQKHGNAGYAIFSTLVYRGYVLNDFVNRPLTEDFLNELDHDFAVVRKAGLKMILRFSYTNTTSRAGNCPDKEKICPPYGDATKSIMLEHIKQLKPILRKNADVIAVLQEGFIGIWGENYYTDYFGDASDNGPGKIMDSSWKDRNDLLKALLEALPEDRMMQVRTPQIKQRFVYGPEASVSAKPLSLKEAFSYSDKARIGFHNDCFLSSPDDYGTYYDYGNSSSPKKAANEILRKYLEQDSRYGPVGGETCDDAFSPGNDCAPIGHAEQEMAAMHFSFLNTAYNNNVNNDWDSLGCINRIKKKLGYRFVLVNSRFPSKLKAGESFSFSVKMENKGYASPYNPRPIELVFRNQQTGKEYFINGKADIRFWVTGKIEWKETVRLPADVPAGKYEILLNLPDKYPALRGRPEYSIRLANQNTWEEKTGYNKLNHFISVGLNRQNIYRKGLLDF